MVTGAAAGAGAGVVVAVGTGELVGTLLNDT